MEPQPRERVLDMELRSLSFEQIDALNDFFGR